ncbi:MAG: DUF3459 domain-containing protein, partial [Janthinobacterium lividum]
GVAGSTLELYRTTIAARKHHRLGRGSLVWDDLTGGDVLAFRTGRVLVVANLGTAPVAVPAGAELLLSSADLVDGAVPTDTTAWFTR